MQARGPSYIKNNVFLLFFNCITPPVFFPTQVSAAWGADSDISCSAQTSLERPCEDAASVAAWAAGKALYGDAEPTQAQKRKLGFTEVCLQFMEANALPPSNWTAWSEWSKCNSTCSTDVQNKTRTCKAGMTCDSSVREMFRPCASASCGGKVEEEALQLSGPVCRQGSDRNVLEYDALGSEDQLVSGVAKTELLKTILV